nr:GNAT family N-acetyltransferase [Iamia sp. SCSIO 61187]
MAGLWRPSWRRDLPGASEAAIDDLVRREAFADAHLRIVDLAVLGGDGVPVAGTQLRIDGATAAIEAVLCDPDHRGRGFATALVADAVRRAREAGCDLVWLLAYADDWPRRWYERLGFVDVGARWVAHRRAAGDPRPPVVGRRTPSGRTA